MVLDEGPYIVSAIGPCIILLYIKEDNVSEADVLDCFTIMRLVMRALMQNKHRLVAAHSITHAASHCSQTIMHIPDDEALGDAAAAAAADVLIPSFPGVAAAAIAADALALL